MRDLQACMKVQHPLSYAHPQPPLKSYRDGKMRVRVHQLAAVTEMGMLIRSAGHMTMIIIIIHNQ